MIKNAIQVFWSKPNDKTVNNNYGFKTLNHFFMSALYSFQCLKKHGYNVKLITDDYGKALLMEYFKIPYDSVDCSLNNLKTSNHLWGLSKFYAFSLQKEPFLYVDLDFFLQKNIPHTYHKAEIICQNIELNYLCYYLGYMGFDKYLSNKEDKEYKNYVDMLHKNQISSSYNTAIFGGTNIDVIKKATNKIFEFVESNDLNEIVVFDKVEKDTLSMLSVFLEQVYLYQYLTLNHPTVTVKPLFKKDIDITFNHFRKWNDGYLHLISHLKRENNEVLETLENLSGQNGFVDIEAQTMGLGYENLLRLSRLEY
jgi:hypothetical protein